MKWARVWRNDWVADAGRFRCVVADVSGGPRWSIGIGDGTAAGFATTLVNWTPGASVDVCKAAAESAALRLLCESVAAFADGAPPSWQVRGWDYGDVEVSLYTEPGAGVSHVLTPERARRLALALLAAAKEPT